MEILFLDSEKGLKNYLKLQKAIIAICFCFLFMAPWGSNAQLIKPNSQAIETTGDVFLVALPASSLLSTFILKDKKGTWQFTKGFLFNQAITFGLKYAINKPRPFDSGYQAFPSGHTSTTFQAASFVHRRYGFKYSIPSYLLASFTAYSRINATRHDGYDVIAGAAIGIGSTFLFTTPREEEMNLTFSSYEDGFVLGFLYVF